MKIHASVDDSSRFVHTITTTSGNQHNNTETHNLIREDNNVVFGDSGYFGLERTPDI